MKLFKVEIPKWEKYNPRNDLKIPSWFRLNHDVFESDSMFELSPPEFLFWIYLLCQVSRKKGDKVVVSEAKVLGMPWFRSLNVESCLSKLKSFEMLNFDLFGLRTDPEQERDVSVHDPNSTLRNGTIRDVTLRDGSSEVARRPSSGPVWKAYAETFKARYGVEPARNQKTNAQAAQLVKRLGLEDAIEVVKFFVKHNASWYTTKGHTIGICLNDAEKLHMEWKSGIRINASTARQAEESDHNRSLYEKMARKERDVTDG